MSKFNLIPEGGIDDFSTPDVNRPIRNRKSWAIMYFALPYANIIGSTCWGISVLLSNDMWSKVPFTYSTYLYIQIPLIILKMLLAVSLIPEELKELAIKRQETSKRLVFFIPLNFITGIVLMGTSALPLIYQTNFPIWIGSIIQQISPSVSEKVKSLITLISGQTTGMIFGIITNLLTDVVKKLFKKKG